MPVILLDGRLASPATTLMKATMGQLASWLENAPTPTNICTIIICMCNIIWHKYSIHDNISISPTSLTQAVQSCYVLLMPMPRVQARKCWRAPLKLFVRLVMLGPTFGCSVAEAMKIVFNNIIETSLIQADTEMKVHPASCSVFSRDSLLNKWQRVDSSWSKQVDPLVDPIAAACCSQGLGPVDHQLLWLHLGPGGDDDWRSHSVSSEACRGIGSRVMLPHNSIGCQLWQCNAQRKWRLATMNGVSLRIGVPIAPNENMNFGSIWYLVDLGSL